MLVPCPVHGTNTSPGTGGRFHLSPVFRPVKSYQSTGPPIPLCKYVCSLFGLLFKHGPCSGLKFCVFFSQPYLFHLIFNSTTFCSSILSYTTLLRSSTLGYNPISSNSPTTCCHGTSFSPPTSPVHTTPCCSSVNPGHSVKLSSPIPTYTTVYLSYSIPNC